MTLRRDKHIPKWRLWVLIVIYVITIGVLGNLLIHPPVSSNKKIDCNKVMSLWNQYEGQAAIEAFKNNDAKSKEFRKDYDHLVMGPAHICFPSQLIDYIIQNP